MRAMLDEKSLDFYPSSNLAGLRGTSIWFGHNRVDLANDVLSCGSTGPEHIQTRQQECSSGKH